MKKTLLFAMILVLVMPCFAANGDIAGEIYSTDILTYVNGKLVEGYNIGGKTAVVIEDLSKGYGVTFNYDEELRLLTADALWYRNYMSGYQPDIARGVPGKVVDNIYETDIKVVLNGKEVAGYNIGGRTAVVIEDIGAVKGGPNAKYGYSEYLCNAEWSETDRTIKLNFVDGYKIGIGTNPVAITVPSVNITEKDDVLIAEYNPLNDIHSDINVWANTDEFIEDKYVLKPMYMQIGDEKHQIGLCYSNGAYIERFAESPEQLNGLLQPLVTEPMPCDEVLRFFDDGTDYITLDSLETEDFYFLVVEDKKAGYEYNDVLYLSVKKTGGYAKVSGSSTHYSERIIEKVGVNKLYVTVSPFAGPHGATSMGMEFDLNNYIFWE